MGAIKRNGCIPCLLVIIILIFLGGCNRPVNIQSKWLDKKIVIDANDRDWIDYPFFYDEKTRSCIGIYNDDKNLYLCFQIMDKDLQRQILSHGLYIWFNKTGGKEKELALCYPEGGGFGGRPGDPGGYHDRSSGMPGRPSEMSRDVSGPPGNRQDGRNMRPGRMFPQGSVQNAMVKIMTSEDDEGYVCNLEKAARFGIEVRYNIDERGRFIYELKMPYVETDQTPFVARTSASNQMGIGFMTANMKKGSPSGDMERGGMGRGGRGDRGGGDMPGGDMGRGGMPGGGMGRGGRMGGGGMGKSKKSLEIWTQVTLAAKPANLK